MLRSETRDSSASGLKKAPSGAKTADKEDYVDRQPRGRRGWWRLDDLSPKPIPRDRWFQLEFYLKRAADATGEVALYQDGEELVRRTGIVTDETPYGEWYVGNCTARLETTPSIVSVYVDDVTVRLP